MGCLSIDDCIVLTWNIGWTMSADYHASKPAKMVYNHFNQSQFTLHITFITLWVLKRMFEHLLCGLSSILILMNQYTLNIRSCGVQILQSILMYDGSLR